MEIAEQLQGQLGPVDILVANAGTAGPDTPAEQMIDEAWQRILDVNLKKWSLWVLSLIRERYAGASTRCDRNCLFHVWIHFQQASKAGELTFLRGSCASFDSFFGR